MKFLSLSILWAVFVFLNLAEAQTELDPQITAPKELVVRVDQNGQYEVYKVATKQNVKDQKMAEAVVEEFVNEENKIQNIVDLTELDKTSSTESWFCYYNPYFGFNNGFTWNFGWGFNNFNYFYRPYYNFGWGNYWYYYYF